MTLKEDVANEENRYANDIDYRRIVISLKDLIMDDFKKWLKEREGSIGVEEKKPT